MDKVVMIDGHEVAFRANARTPRLYRALMRRDIIRDLNQLKGAFNKAMSLVKLPKPGPDSSPEEIEEYNRAVEEKQLSALDLEIFENVAYIMAFQADSSIPKTADEWLEGFNTFSIYKVLPHILELWGLNMETTSTPKNV